MPVSAGLARGALRAIELFKVVCIFSSSFIASLISPNVFNKFGAVPTKFDTAVDTNCVVANCVVLVPLEAVGANGVPVKVGEAKLDLRATPLVFVEILLTLVAIPLTLVATSLLLVTICAIKSAPPNTPDFVKVPVNSMLPSAYNPSMEEVFPPLGSFVNPSYVSDFHALLTYPSKSEPVHLIEPATSATAFPIIIPPLA